jgi:hypothetical protein
MGSAVAAPLGLILETGVHEWSASRLATLTPEKSCRLMGTYIFYWGLHVICLILKILIKTQKGDAIVR